MFEFIRNRQKLMMFVLLLFIAPAFVLLGVDGYNVVDRNANALAKVGDYYITQEEFDANKRERIERARAQAGAEFDPTVFDRPEINRALLDEMVLEQLLAQSVRKQYLTATDAALAQEIREVDLFQVDGRFNLEAYRNVLAASGLSEQQYEANVRFDLARRQVLGPLAMSAQLPPALADNLDDVQLAGRVIRLKALPLADFTGQVQIEANAAQVFYEANQNQFTLPAKANVEFVTLSADDIRKTVTVSEAEVTAYYEQNKARFSTPAERRARHILLEDEAKANEVLAKLKADRSQFEALAKAESVDTGSAQEGGDLGFFGRGAMVPEFDQAVFEGKVGELTELVKSQFGFHIIEVLDTRGGESQPLEDVRTNLVREIQDQKMTTQFADAQGRFSELVFEGGQSFANVVSQLGLQPQRFEGLTAQPVEGAPEALQDPAVLSAIFSETSIQNRNNTRAVQSGDQLVSARIVDYTPPTAQPFEAVKSAIENRLRQDEAAKLAAAQAQTVVGQLNDTKPSTLEEPGFGEPQLISALGAGGVPTTVVQAALDTPASDLPLAKSINLGSRGYAVVWVERQASSTEVKAGVDPLIIQYYEGLSQQAYQDAMIVAARDAMQRRIAVDIRRKFE